MRILLIILPFFIVSCAVRVEEAATKVALVSKKKVTWPGWTPSNFAQRIKKRSPFDPHFIKIPHGEVVTYGPHPDGCEHFAIISEREENQKPGLFPLRLCFLPTSMFAGPSPLAPSRNTLLEKDRKWFYSAYNFRSTFFDLYPAKTETLKGLLVYHTSIMLLSIAEKKVIENFRKRGWNVMVGLPPDSLYRTKLPALMSKKGSLQNAAEFVAEDIDRHYAEQAFSTRAALDYLAQTRPAWLSGKRVLMGTSAGTFGLPAEALMNPGWDALIFVSGGTNLISLYESGSAGLFNNSLQWLAEARKAPPIEVTRIFNDEEYHEIFHRAASMTRLHSGALAPQIRDQRILMIAGTVDHIMPVEQALGLHRALGSPERWTAPLGHHLIALQLILEVDRIDDWIMNPPSAN
ncbi:MAG: hypothetical protein ACJAQT_004441 [Akkermansiaceae bacterium]